MHRQQRGMITLALSLLVLFISSMMIFYTSSGMLLDIKIGNNQYYQTKALESARGGSEHALAWLMDAGNVSALKNAANWSSDATGPNGNNQKASTTIFPAAVNSQTIGNSAVAVTLWRNSATPDVLEISATTSGDAQATIRQRLVISSQSTQSKLSFTTTAPIVVNGNLDAKGNPSVSPGANGTAIVTSNSSLSFTGSNHLTVLNNGQILYNQFSGSQSAWNYLSNGSITAQQIKDLAAAGASNVYYYNSGSYTLPSILGTASSPIILYFDTGAGCPKINGGKTVYGIVYVAQSCDFNGWGGTTIIGSLVVEGSIGKLNANTVIKGWDQAGGSIDIITGSTSTSTMAKKTASWRDF